LLKTAKKTVKQQKKKIIKKKKNYINKKKIIHICNNNIGMYLINIAQKESK
jgi:hypothetical protein